MRPPTSGFLPTNDARTYERVTENTSGVPVSQNSLRSMLGLTAIRCDPSGFHPMVPRSCGSPVVAKTYNSAHA